MDDEPDEAVEIVRRTEHAAPTDEAVRQALAAVFAGESIDAYEVSVALVDDAEIHEVNNRFLQHDYPTDVVTFNLSSDDDLLEGEIVISCQYAAAEAEKYQWPAEHETLLYVIHGGLHLAGYDDHEEEDRLTMRRLERVYLEKIGLEPPESHRHLETSSVERGSVG
ncbi:rRNA maturation RNase YbeY [Blastopirellula marina]|uniref:Endoribonuclease YbeY n=1 Tax=Blastopirellula marina TaxID=124 RepID=A0A2S8GAU7_9BACT|nr:rRNA maturation RNase YbeY [Blastopirellula marina]PQO41563.1 rRNA maturation RNase YbeY [Blastopirellula marina]